MINVISLFLAFVWLLLSRIYSYILFHTFVELFSVVIAWNMFAIILASRERHVNGFYAMLGIAYFFVGFIDLIHTLSYKGMNIFSGFDANLPTQLWIVARYMESLSFFASIHYVNRPIGLNRVFCVYLLITAISILAIFGRIFPDCFIEGRGLTTFKIMSEFVICLILMLNLVLVKKRSHLFNNRLYKYIGMGIIFTIASELSFTLYVDVYGVWNMIGHYFKVVSFYFIYKAIIETSVKMPYETIYKDLMDHQEKLIKEQEELKKAQAEVKVLKGLLPICSSCKKIRTDDGYWVQLEKYLSEHGDIMFTHGICPECAKTLYPELKDLGK